MAVQVQKDADQPVQRHLGHHPAHQRRDMAGRCRMGQRQPGVQWHQTGFGPGPQNRQQHHQEAGHRRQRRVAHGGEGIGTLRAGQQAETGQQAEGPERRHHQIDHGRRAVFGVLVVGQHQQPRRQRHELPRYQEHEGVVGDQHRVHAEQEQRKERSDPPGLGQVVAIADAEHRRRHGPHIDDHHEQRRQIVKAEMGRHPRQAEGKDDGGAGARRLAQMLEPADQQGGAGQGAAAVDDAMPPHLSPGQHAEHGKRQ